MSRFPRYEGNKADLDHQDGRLRTIMGVHHYQVIRACREGDGAEGWTFHHNPLLAYWNGQFLLQYITCPVGENCPPSRTMLVRSRNGVEWTEPVTLFPPYPILAGDVYRDDDVNAVSPGTYAMMHQRSGFYISGSGRMLCLGFYGITPHPDRMPNDGRGIGRVVRELSRDGRLGPIYFIRYNRHAGWNESNTNFPHYTEAKDQGFVEACEELLKDRLATLSWWEEDRSPDGMYTLVNVKAPVYYKLQNGNVVVFGKWSKVAVSRNNGTSWDGPHTEPSIVMAGSKIWAQRYNHDKYLIAYNPNPSNEKRWPLAVSLSDDGLVFKNMYLLCGEVPVRRYEGNHKHRGMNYVSGIAEGNGEPPGDYIWLTFSMNKEDIWVSKVPLSMETEETEMLHEEFADSPTSGDLSRWQLYRPLWSEFVIESFPEEGKRRFKMSNGDPYQQAVAERTFPKCPKATVHLGVVPLQADYGLLEIVLMAGEGHVFFRIRFDSDSRIIVGHAGGRQVLMNYEARREYDLVISLDLEKGQFGVDVLGGAGIRGLPCLTKADTAERIAFRIGGQLACEYAGEEGGDVPGDRRVENCTYYLNYVKVIPDSQCLSVCRPG